MLDKNYLFNKCCILTFIICAFLVLGASNEIKASDNLNLSSADPYRMEHHPPHHPMHPNDPHKIKPKPAPAPLPEQTELWVGTIYTSKFKCGFCFSPSGKARGVLFLKPPFGEVDVYHLYGTFKNGKVDARHSSGHHVKGQVLPGNKVKGKIRLGDGRRVSFKGTRIQGVRLAKEDCAPLEAW
ncbi:MAG: hypothetical protein IJU40_03875 [Desulfovibrionaceae bacterium]|nr:hypothetical protein [Desulfovibrionaceae bacterium]